MRFLTTWNIMHNYKTTLTSLNFYTPFQRLLFARISPPKKPPNLPKSLNKKASAGRLLNRDSTWANGRIISRKWCESTYLIPNKVWVPTCVSYRVRTMVAKLKSQQWSQKSSRGLEIEGSRSWRARRRTIHCMVEIHWCIVASPLWLGSTLLWALT